MPPVAFLLSIVGADTCRQIPCGIFEARPLQMPGHGDVIVCGRFYVLQENTSYVEYSRQRLTTLIATSKASSTRKLSESTTVRADGRTMTCTLANKTAQTNHRFQRTDPVTVVSRVISAVMDDGCQLHHRDFCTQNKLFRGPRPMVRRACRAKPRQGENHRRQPYDQVVIVLSCPAATSRTPQTGLNCSYR